MSAGDWVAETAAVECSLDAWGFGGAEVSLLSVSENLVFMVVPMQGAPVVARLHRAGYNSLAAMESEHAWVTALGEAEIAVACPLPASDGRSHVPVTVGDNSTLRYVGVIESVDGSTLSSHLDTGVSVGEAARWFGRLGSVLARLHNQAEQWTPPAGFTRRAWDGDGLLGPDPQWGRFWAVDAATEHQREVMARARDSLRVMLDDLGTEAGCFGLIHADLYADNALVVGDDLVLIDFDDAGYGWHLHDLAVAVFDQSERDWFPAVRDGLLGGYREQRPLSADHERLLSSFLLIRALSLVGWLADRPELDPNGERLALDIANAVQRCERYLDGVDPFG